MAVRKSWDAYNKKVFKKGILEYKQKLDIELKKMCEELANDVLDFIEEFDSIEDMPFFTGNLADGTGLGVYVNGSLQYFMPAQKAIDSQTYEDYDGDIWGADFLMNALSQSESSFPKGIWVVLYSTVPYAAYVDNEGAPHTSPDYFSGRLHGEMLNSFRTAFMKRFPDVTLIM